jgi:hypothetical protein
MPRCDIEYNTHVVAVFLLISHTGIALDGDNIARVAARFEQRRIQRLGTQLGLVDWLCSEY